MIYTASWQSPSNIAIIKYWGKHGVQLPQNPSLSFTLSECRTIMTLTVIMDQPASLEILYDNQPRPAFEGKIQSFFQKIHSFFPWIKNASIRIDSHNTFPHGAGIASSASAMSALALCLQDIHDQMAGSADTGSSWWQRVSKIARLGSGSACRSVFPLAAAWGQSADLLNSSDQYAISWADHIHPFYKTYQDTILIVSPGEKAVSSSAGHALMENHPYAPARYAEAKQNLSKLLPVLQHDHLVYEFISICESEALQLHALMMCSYPPYLLMTEGTLNIIKSIWQFRKETSLPVCFTLDAGPNVHILYPAAHRDSIFPWIKRELIKFCADDYFIADHIGSGPEKLKSP